MNRLLYGLAALPFLAGVSLAAQPAPLTDTQMDVVTAGFDFAETETQNTGVVRVLVNQTGPGNPQPCANCYINVVNTYFNDSPAPNNTIAMQTLSKFGPEPITP
jgi:hypothetical protein